MTYQVIVSPSARRALHALPMDILLAVGALLDELEINPHRLGGELDKEWEGYRSARRGPYRVIYRIHEREVYVYVARIGHRAYAFRPR